MEKVMSDYFWGFLALFGVVVLWGVITTIPFWLVWNYIIATKFVLPTFTLFQSFWITMVIKFLFTSNVKVIKKD